ncbi:EamA family transporter [Gloeocapsopsis sp. AAB1 = 1H9]|uniref:EamA family transporter n=2 Tax=Gloeocapsopsis TaxID=693222 RepID=A0A6N8FXB2_9CHRO|nr:EamA family transporter [Gloeocapsopsis dulcis AAB1 = 1H9]
MSAREWLLLVVLSILWGSSFFFIKIILQELQPLSRVFIRVGLAAIALTTFVYMRGQRMPASPRIWRAFLVMGALNNLIPFTLIVWGQTHINSSLAAILNATTPVFTVVLAHFIHDQRLTLNRLVGVLLGLCGAIVLIGSEVLYELNLQSLGQFAILGAAISYSFAGIYGRRFRKLSPVVTATGMLISTTIMMLPLTLLWDWSFKLSIITWSALLGLAILSTAIAYLIYFHLLAAVGATNLLLVTFLIPISALLLGVFILNEQLTWNAIAGMALIFVGLVAIDGRLVSKIKQCKKQ